MVTAIDVGSLHRARINALGMGPQAVGLAGVQPGADGVSFGDTLQRALGEVSGMQDQSAELTDAFLRGDPSVEMHQVMAAAEEAGIAVEMLVGVVNRVQEAYRSLVSLQS